MEDKALLSIGETAAYLGLSRDAVTFALRSGAPEPETPRVGNRRVFSKDDVERLREWFIARGRNV